ncbi:MAG: hypothetical protein A2458_01680 [Candidatus Kerfeldbacteria bacterium RIFOXYC2_FULL_38_9]|nr:MAG: hypothetical protein A2458_01680 [Candidatus Kerfeldbacteria bacterium RIFOXYC2_FULL_38_9]
MSAKGRTTTAATNDLPAQQRKQFSSANQQVINFSDNASFRMSAYSLKNSADTMTVIITPTAEVPSTNTHQVLSYAYEAEALDGNNSTVGKFSGSVAVTLPYTESQLAAFNVTAEDITMAIYDGLAWQDVTGAVVNASAHTITANVTGFGTFAITTSVRNAAEDNLDATTPDQPTNLRILKNSRQAKSFTVKWKAVENADAYEVELYQDAHSTTPLATYTVTKNQKKIVKQKANTLYRVRVRALDGELFSDWTSYQSVRTRPQLPSNLRIFQKTVKENGEGYFKVSFNQPKNRKKLKAVIQVVDETGQQIDFQLGQKEKWQKKSSFKMKAKKKLQKRAITVADQYLHTPLRVKVRSARILKTKSTLYRSAFVQSSLFLIEY